MAYTPHTWTTGETVDAAKLNANEQGTQAAAAAADTANTGLTSKVNSSTYTAGLAGKADLVSGTVPDAQLPARLADASLKAAFVVSSQLLLSDTRPGSPAMGLVRIGLAVTGTADTTAPTVPTGLTVTPGNAQNVLAWTASTDAVGVTGYKVRRGGTIVGTSTTTSYTDTGLTNGTAYSYTVSAVDAAANESAQTSAVTGTPTAGTTVPGAPTGLGATAGNAQAALSWTAPASNGGAAITDYTVQYRTTAGPGAWTTFTHTAQTTTTITVTGLTNGTGYDFQVAAVNSVGTGAYSTTASASPTAGGGNVTASIVSMQSTTVLSSVGGSTRSIGLPATVAAGDILVILAAVQDPPAYTFTAPAGWTTRLINGDAGNGNQGFVLTKTATGNEGGTSIVTTWNVGPDETLQAQAYALRGIASETPVATGSGPLAYNGGPTVPTLTGLPADTMVLAAGWAHVSPATSTAPAGMTQDAVLSSGNETAAFVHQYLASGGSAGGNAWTFSGSGNGGSLAVAFS